MRLKLTGTFILLAILNCGAQNETTGLVNWLSLEEAQEKYKEAPKPVILDFYTDWCGWCKHMMKTTYSNPNIAGYINQHFYAVKFNGETKDTVEFQGTVYKPYSPDPKTPHELTVKFLGERISYPSTIFMTNDFNYSLLVPGYMDEKKIEPLLVFMAENTWQTTSFDAFKNHFAHAFYDTAYEKNPVVITPIEELERLQKKEPRKVLVSLNAGFSNTGKVMNKTTFSDTSVADYINQNFYLVQFDITRNDTVHFQGGKYFPTPVNGFPFHSLGFRLTNNRFTVPSVCILDEKLQTIDVLNFYQGPERLKPVLKYIAEDIYKKKAFAEFIEEYGKKPESTKQ